MRRYWLIFAQAVTVCLGILFVVTTLRPDLLRLTDDPDEAVEIVVRRSAELRAQEEAVVRANAEAEQAAAESAGW